MTRTPRTLALALAGMLSCFGYDARAQFDAGLIVGGTAYEGELAPVNRFRHFRQARLAVGAFGRYQFSSRAAVRLGYTYLSVEGSDITRPSSRTRNHRFVTDIHEIVGTLEYYFLGTDRRLAPFLTAGAGAFHYNPTTDFEGRRYALRPLGTEGQGLPGYEDLYDRWAFALPIGGGLRYELTPSLLLGLEAVGRFTVVDHIDDISRRFYVPLEALAQNPNPLTAELSFRGDELNPNLRPGDETPRANPDTNDYYLTLQLSVAFRFGQGGVLPNRRRYSGKPIDCPTF